MSKVRSSCIWDLKTWALNQCETQEVCSMSGCSGSGCDRGSLVLSGVRWGWGCTVERLVNSFGHRSRCTRRDWREHLDFWSRHLPDCRGGMTGEETPHQISCRKLDPLNFLLDENDEFPADLKIYEFGFSFKVQS